MSRPAVGIITLLLFLGALVLWIYQPEEYLLWLSACLRVGIVMAALWLALPELERVPRWAAKACVLVALAVVCITKPRIIPFALVIWLLITLIIPRAQAFARRILSPDA